MDPVRKETSEGYLLLVEEQVKDLLQKLKDHHYSLIHHEDWIFEKTMVVESATITTVIRLLEEIKDPLDTIQDEMKEKGIC